MTSEVIHYFPPSFSDQIKRALLEVKLQKKLPKVEREIREAFKNLDIQLIASDYGVTYGKCYLKFSFNFGSYAFNSWDELSRIQKIARKLRARIQFICYAENDNLRVDMYFWIRV